MDNFVPYRSDLSRAPVIQNGMPSIRLRRASPWYKTTLLAGDGPAHTSFPPADLPAGDGHAPGAGPVRGTTAPVRAQASCCAAAQVLTIGGPVGAEPEGASRHLL